MEISADWAGLNGWKEQYFHNLQLLYKYNLEPVLENNKYKLYWNPLSFYDFRDKSHPEQEVAGRAHTLIRLHKKVNVLVDTNW